MKSIPTMLCITPLMLVMTMAILPRPDVSSLNDLGNPFEEIEGLEPPNYPTITVVNHDGDITYQVNGSDASMERVNAFLERIAKLDKTQTIVIRLQSDASPRDLADITSLLLKHGLKYVARCDEQGQAIWIHDKTWME